MEPNRDGRQLDDVIAEKNDVITERDDVASEKNDVNENAGEAVPGVSGPYRSGAPAEHGDYLQWMRRGAVVPAASASCRPFPVLPDGSEGDGAAAIAVSHIEDPADLSASDRNMTIGDRSLSAVWVGSVSGVGGIVHKKSPRQQYRSRGSPTRSQASRSVSAGSLWSSDQYRLSLVATTRPQVKHRTGGRSVMAGLCMAGAQLRRQKAFFRQFFLLAVCIQRWVNTN